jgi:hypothetical protein
MTSARLRLLTAVGALTLACGSDGGDTPQDDGTTSGVDTDVADSSGTSPSTTAPSTTDNPSTTATTNDTDVDATRPNWEEDIAPLVMGNCVGCHVEGGIAPFGLDTYEEARNWAAASAIQVQERLMPPWHAVETDECQPPLAFKHDARLDDEEIALLVDWAVIGAPQGDPALAAALPEPVNLDLAEPSATVTLAGGVEVGGTQLDAFHCLSFDPGHTSNVYVDGMQVLPGNRELVHHVLMFVDTEAESADWPGGVSENCGGGAGVGGALLVGGWVPGSMPIHTPDNVGILLPQGARIIFNMHYHNGTGAAQTDEGTGVALRWSTTLPQYVGSFQLIGAPGGGNIVESPFMIPAEATGHIERVRFTVPDLGVPEVRVFSMTNHMHKVGVDMKATMTRNGDETCMLQTPRWDFGWQRQYLYDAEVGGLPEVFPGDVIEVRCTYDNVLTNPGVAEMLAEVGLDEPQDVSLGEGTLDEMCLAGVGIAVRPF